MKSIQEKKNLEIERDTLSRIKEIAVNTDLSGASLKTRKQVALIYCIAYDRIKVIDEKS